MRIADIAIDAGQILQMDAGDNTIIDGTILIKDDHIVYVGKRLAPSDYAANQYINAKENLALPPFFNQHTHPSLSVYRGLGVDLALNDWLEKAMWPLEQNFSNPDNVYLGSQLSIIEMIRGGIGATANMDYHNRQVGKAYHNAGIRAFIGEAIFSAPTPCCSTPESAFDYTESLKSEFAYSELVEPFLAVHAPYTSNPELYRKTAQLAEKLGIQTTSHVSESLKELEWCREKYGISPVELLESTGILATDFSLIHGVHLSETDISILNRNSVPVIHNPHSNMVLGSGVCNVPLLIESGIKVGLGTDSAASNNSLSMLKEMQTMVRLHKADKENAEVIPAKIAIHMATKAGYEIYNIMNSGSLIHGNKADMQIINLNKSHNVPDYDPVSALVYSAGEGDVLTLIVNGQIIMLDQQILTIDEEIILREANDLAKSIRQFSGIE